MPKLDDDEFETIAEQMIRDAIDYTQSTVAPHVEKAWRYYHREVDAKAGDGSSVVVSEVSDVIDATLPPMIEPFISGGEIGRFEPMRALEGMPAAHMDEQAQQETDFANYVFFQLNDGFRTIHDAAMDGLMGFGDISVYWDERFEYDVDEFSGWTELQVRLEHEKDGQRIISSKPMVDEDGNPVVEMGQPLYEGKREIERNHSQIRVECMAQEDLLIDGDIQSADDARVIGRYSRTTVSDVMALELPGVEIDDVTAMARSYNAGDTEQSLVEQARTQRRLGHGNQQETAEHLPNHFVNYADVLVKIDKDGDGITESYRVHALCLEETVKVLHVEDAEDGCQEVIWSPYRTTHAPIGEGQAHKVMDLQDQQTAVWRRMFDNLSDSTNPDIEISGDHDGMLTSIARTLRFGRIFPTSQPGQVNYIQKPFVASQALTVSQSLDERRIQRTGISPASQGLDPNALKGQTTDAASAIVDAAKARPEFFARMFAETCIKPVMQRIAELARKHIDRPVHFQLRGRVVEVDPSKWATKTEYKPTVGLGFGTRQERMAMLAFVLDQQKQIMATAGPDNPWATPETLRTTLVDIAELMGAYNGERYFPKPDPQAMQAYQQRLAQQAQQPGEDDKDRMAAAQKAQIDSQTKVRIEGMKQQGKLVELRTKEIQRDQDREDQQRHEIEKIAASSAARHTEMEHEAELERQLGGSDVRGRV